MADIIDIGSKKKYYYRFTLLINYNDNTEEEVECTFFGTSVDNPKFLLFSNFHPDSDEDQDIPDLMANTDNVKSIRTKNIEKIER